MRQDSTGEEIFDTAEAMLAREAGEIEAVCRNNQEDYLTIGGLIENIIKNKGFPRIRRNHGSLEE